MSKSVMSDAGVGRALFTTYFGLAVQAFQLCFMLGLVPAFITPMIYWYATTPSHEVSIVKLELLSYVYDDTPRFWRIDDELGRRVVVSATLHDGRIIRRFTPAQVRSVLTPYYRPVRSFYSYLSFSAIAALLGYLSVWLILRQYGAQNQRNQRVSGALYIVEPKLLDRLVRRNGASRYKLVDVSLPKDAPMTGILALGSQGSGKSVAIHELMMQVFKAKRKCIIYDQSGEFFRSHFRPGIDRFFNPALVGSVPWSLFSELRFSYDADTMARSFLPPRNEASSGNNGFFEDAARALFSVILLRLRERGAVYTSDIARAFLDMPDAEMDELIANSIASSAVGGDSKQQRQGVISSIAIYLNGISAVQNGVWTISDFLAEPGDGRLFILGTEDTRAMFAPLFRLMLACAFSAIESRGQIVTEDRYWFFLDEVHQLGDIRLDEKLALLRKFGVCIVSGIQSDQQFTASLGQERAGVVMNCFNSVLLLRAVDDGMQQRAAKRLGEIEETVVNRNQQLAVMQWRDGSALTQLDRQKFVVVPSEFSLLNPCVGYLKFAGNLPAAKVDYSDWLPRHPWRRARILRWRAINEMPFRDPAFIIHVANQGDVFESIRRDAAQRSVEKDEGSMSNGLITDSGSTGSSDASSSESVDGVPNPNPTVKEVTLMNDQNSNLTLDL